MSTRHYDGDGSDIFWPGYVDATTNLILNLLFLLTILIVAVFMFALEMGRSTPVAVVKEPVATTRQAEKIVPEVATDPVQENIALKREIQRLKMMLAQQGPQEVQAGDLVKTVEATSNAPKPLTGIDIKLADNTEVVVRFKDEAVAFTPAEQARLIESLQPIVARGQASLLVEVPAGFSEAKRMGFYRAMAVRNLLIEMKLPNENINVAVTEGKNNVNPSLVRVRTR